MKKIAAFITKRKIWIILFFLAASVASALFVGKVKINYDLSKYLSSESETSLALKIVEDEFGSNGNMQVMVGGVDRKTSEQIKDDIEEINYVLAVDFDSESEYYYKDNNALYVLIIDGDDYSEHARSVADDVKVLLADYETYYGGTSIDKERLQEAIQNEMVYIVIAAVSLAAGILLLTSESWIEPLLLLLTAGVAILINLGTNAFFPSISYITNSISAILQLALSIDYSIVLLHTYRKNKGELGNEEAMKKTIVEVIKPISASGLTTLAGLCALLFMSYRIGFDIGIVLMKGILISLLTSLTLLPGVILFCDKALVKTHKKAIRFSGSFCSNLAAKGNKAIVPLGLIVICVCGALNFNNSYTYSNQSNVDPEIANTFGQNNQFMVVFPKENGSYENQEAFVSKISEFRNEDGSKPFVDYTSYTNTAMEKYDAEKIERKLSIDSDEAKMLLTMYNLYKQPSVSELTFSDFIHYAGTLLYTTSTFDGGYAQYQGITPTKAQEADGTAVTEYTFRGWDASLSNISSPTDFHPKFTSETFTGHKVTFMDDGGKNELYSHYFKEGTAATYPYETPWSYDDESVTMFFGWSASLSSIVKETTVSMRVKTIAREQNGEYPQTKVTDQNTISALKGLHQPSDGSYLRYGGEKYELVKSDYYRVEPIRWRYLGQDDGSALFLSERILDAKRYNDSWDGTNENGYYANNYKQSEIRKWLNDEFLDKAFGDPSLMATTAVDNSVSSTGDSSNPYVCETTNDKAFLLSYKETTSREFGFTGDQMRVAYGTDYAKANGLFQYSGSNNASYWWLRSPGSDISSRARYVYYYGDVGSGYVSYSGIGVRPAIRFNLA